MDARDLFSTHRSSKKLNESLQKVFGKKINFENFSLDQLQDARNKIRTQLSQVRNESGFNESVENEAYHEAKFMLDTINAEIAEREEYIVDSLQTEQIDSDDLEELMNQYKNGDISLEQLKDQLDSLEQTDYSMRQGEMGNPDWKDDQTYNREKSSWDDADDSWPDEEESDEQDLDDEDDEYGEFPESIEQVDELSTKTLSNYVKGRGAQLRGGSEDRPKIKGMNAALRKIKQNQSNIKEQGEDMRNLREGEIQQAQSIVSAKTMVDRVGRWIEELSGMENDSLIQLGDQVRDEMGAEMAKQFISSVAPAIQQALDNLKQTRETLSTGVRLLTGEEQGAEMLGGDPAAGMDMSADPDMMNQDPSIGAEPEDDFAAAEPAAGPDAAGREQRESIQYQNRLMKVLAG